MELLPVDELVGKLERRTNVFGVTPYALSISWKVIPPARPPTIRETGTRRDANDRLAVLDPRIDNDSVRHSPASVPNRAFGPSAPRPGTRHRRVAYRKPGKASSTTTEAPTVFRLLQCLRSSVVSPGCLPSSRSTRRTQRRIVFGVHPSFCEIDFIAANYESRPSAAQQPAERLDHGLTRVLGCFFSFMTQSSQRIESSRNPRRFNSTCSLESSAYTTDLVKSGPHSGAPSLWSARCGRG